MKPPKIIHSFWSKPTMDYSQIVVSNAGTMDRKAGGWVDKKFSFMSWALSCLSIKKHYPEVELVTDTSGKKVLIDMLELPYTNVVVALDKLNNQHVELWATAKFTAYQLQTQPFIHVDSDVFIWDRFNETIENAGLVVQNEEAGFDSYKNTWKQINENFIYIPDFIRNDYTGNQIIRACNAGIFGGNDIDFLHEFVEEALVFLKKNEPYYDKINVGYSVLIYEQYLFSCLARSKNKKINYLFESVNDDYNKVLDIKNVARDTKFVHIVGDKKRKLEFCLHLENRLLLEYPDYYYKIMELLEKQEL